MKKPILFSIVLLCFLAAGVKAGVKPEKEVKKAFELRMSGKVDEAKTLLEKVLAKDSTVAMAHYEMARLKHYMMVGSGEMNIEGTFASASKAVSCDPENVTYAYFKAISAFMKAFMAMHTGDQGAIKDNIAETCILMEKVLALKPDYCEPMQYLVEIYGMLPKEMGGDSLKAVAWAEKLAATDKYFGARAKAVLTPEGTSMIKFWEDQIIMNGRTPELLRQAGIACLFEDKPEEAEKFFEEAMKADPSKNPGMLDLGRYHMMMVMQDRELAATELPLAKIFFEKYLVTVPEPVVPLKAYTLGLLARVEMFMGNQEAGDKLMEEANALDKYFSKASGVPNLMLFEPPDKICHQYFSFFSPF
ncbi:MAG: tetratricopeptide repeat protein [Lentimicrobium sp.]